jgi:hypothetical protein
MLVGQRDLIQSELSARERPKTMTAGGGSVGV